MTRSGGGGSAAPANRCTCPAGLRVHCGDERASAVGRGASSPSLELRPAPNRAPAGIHHRTRGECTASTIAARLRIALLVRSDEEGDSLRLRSGAPPFRSRAGLRSASPAGSVATVVRFSAEPVSRRRVADQGRERNGRSGPVRRRGGDLAADPHPSSTYTAETQREDTRGGRNLVLERRDLPR